MALLDVLVVLLFGGPDASKAHPTAPEDWITGGTWETVQGTALSKVEGTGWAQIRGPR